MSLHAFEVDLGWGLLGSAGMEQGGTNLMVLHGEYGWLQADACDAHTHNLEYAYAWSHSHVRSRYHPIDADLAA